ncbi:MAG TPA: hypothetical protein VM286_03010 [Candidatus Thermoplasmatota archaeon]|nr:hypothetical protein [Candidatus Thermoplasmatota archaeon]
MDRQGRLAIAGLAVFLFLTGCLQSGGDARERLGSGPCAGSYRAGPHTLVVHGGFNKEQGKAPPSLTTVRADLSTWDDARTPLGSGQLDARGCLVLRLPGPGTFWIDTRSTDAASEPCSWSGGGKVVYEGGGTATFEDIVSLVCA